ncbi:hypothetical protein CK203_021994 [Vitis vinifera]|nr:hypothetical protein CK203_021994 [Vitis vinifera]
MKYVMGTAKPPAGDDLKYEVWDAKNSMVMSWLLHSMQLEMGVPSQIFELKQQIVNTEQGSSTVTRGVSNEGGHHTTKSGKGHQTAAVEDSQEAIIFNQGTILGLQGLVFTTYQERKDQV